MSTANHLKPGIYAHYKSTPEKPMLYLVDKENIVMFSEPNADGSLQELVVYRCLYENPVSSTWARPREMFESTVEVAGETIPRFRYLASSIEALPKETQTKLKIK